MTVEFKLPEVAEGVESADVAEILVAAGDVVEAGQVVMEIETEKAVVELACPYSGKVIKVHVSQGTSIPIGAPLLTIEESTGANAEKKSAAAPAPMPAEPNAPPASRSHPEPVRQQQAAVEPAAKERAAIAGEAPPAPAGPATRRLARQLGVDLRQVLGTGPGKRVTPEDVRAFIRGIVSASKDGSARFDSQAPPLPDFRRFGAIDRKPLSKLAKTSAANLSLAWRTIPHVTQHDLADITDLESARKSYTSARDKSGPKLTMTVLMVKAACAVLKEFPNFNSSLDSEANELVLKRYYHIGVAVDTEHGLVVPVIRDADQKSIMQLAAELGDLAEKARHRKLSTDEMQGGTFTITNLGGIGGTAFTPIVNYPEVAILGMSRSQKQIALFDGKPVERLMLPLSLSYDHRVVNGADAARFLVRLSQLLSDFFELVVAS